MKATGIVRRIDDLGRVVVPKELRDSLKITEGDTIEIFTAEDGEIVLKKYSPMAELSDIMDSYANTLSKAAGTSVIITDKDSIVASSNVDIDISHRPVGDRVKQVFDERRVVTFKSNAPSEVVEHPEFDSFTAKNFVITPVISPAGDFLGTVILASTNELTEFESKIAETAASFIAKQVEVD
ncbi:MAG: stage V sporulation T C-terminal domain-containing protein [Firmicutes bacterium]|nr:stage V sporulation T C-terminal domain-containing protein [Bacillota bacterium]MDD4264101.1 stage V sporulation T C-terminal domain-containing protein [Bacillota bacterium]MDD4692874.1 stage V sporulation T C-terminal domain-containing protein [Bacillota bacterium]